jgi:hypothetical protein
MYTNACSLTIFYQKVTSLGLLDSRVFAVQYGKYGLVSADLGQQTLSGLALFKQYRLDTGVFCSTREDLRGFHLWCKCNNMVKKPRRSKIRQTPV